MDTGLAGRNVLITGAGRNIGRETALLFAREGANVALCTRNNIDGLEATAEEARALGVKVHVGRVDVADGDSVRAFVSSTLATFGRIDVAVNNAVHRAEGGFLEKGFEDFSTNLGVNLFGPFHVCQAVLPGMMKAGWGRIVNYSGIAPFVGTGAIKGAAKLGIVGFTRGLATEFSPHGITANCIGPGTIDVERDAWQLDKPLDPKQPVRRMGKPEEIAALTVFLASEQAGFITGQCYLANGGRYYL